MGHKVQSYIVTFFFSPAGFSWFLLEFTTIYHSSKQNLVCCLVLSGKQKLWADLIVASQHLKELMRKRGTDCSRGPAVTGQGNGTPRSGGDTEDMLLSDGTPGSELGTHRWEMPPTGSPGIAPCPGTASGAGQGIPRFHVVWKHITSHEPFRLRAEQPLTH